MRHSLKKLSFFLIPILFFACSKLENLADDVPVYIDTDLLHNSLTVQFINIDEVWENRPTDIKVEITGKDSDKVYSLLGERNIQIAENHLKVGIRKNELATPENPIEFTVTATAPGFEPAVKNFSLTGSETAFTFMYLADEAALPSGMERNENSGNVVVNGLAEAVAVNATLSGETAASVSIEFPKNGRFFTKNGLTLKNNFNVSLTAMDNFSDQASHLFPGGFSGETLNAVTEKQEKLHFTPICFGSMNVTVDGEKATQTSVPFNLSVQISSNYINPRTGEGVVEGDEIDLWGMNLGETNWMHFNTSAVQARNGNMYVNLQGTDLPDYWAATVIDSGDSNIEFNVNSDVSMSSPTALYYVIFRQLSKTVTPGSQIMYEGYHQLYRGEKIRVMNQGPSGFGLFEVYESKYQCNGGELLSKSFFAWEPGSDNGTFVRDFSRVNVYVDDNALNSQSKFEIAIDVFGVCAGGDTVLRAVPSIALQYSNIECGQGEYELLGRLESGIGSTTALEPGKSYNFFYEHADLSRSLFDFPITRGDTTYIIESDYYDYYEEVNIDFDTLNNRIDFQWHNALVPERACEEYRRYY